ncbi:MAG: hypothetical protein ABIR29_06255 [Chthoniobacterales bacterium]
MSSKVANLIALELGLVIALLAWLAFSNFRPAQLPSAPQPIRLVDSFASVSPWHRSRTAPPAPVDYRAESSESAVEVESLPAAQEYEPANTTEEYLSAPVETAYVNALSPSYAVAEPEPLLASPDCFFPSPNRYFVYPQSTAFVVVSNSQSLRRQPRAPVRGNGMRPRATPQRPPNFHRPRGGRDTAAPRPNTHLQPPRARQNPRPHQNPYPDGEKPPNE